MNLGERIYRLRSEKNLSQGDLAEMLDVSRQSISKWENNSAVPDLDKIVRLSEIFGVSMDALVKGESDRESHQSGEQGKTDANMEKVEQEATCDAEHNATKKAEAIHPAGFPPRMIVGTILFCMAFIVAILFLAVGGGLVGLVLALPFLGCGTICFVCKENIGLWCGWLLYILLDFYMRLATGMHSGAIVGIIKHREHYGHTWTIYAIVSLVLFGILLTLVTVTFRRFWKRPLANNKANLMRIIVSWLIVLAVQVVFMILPYTGIYSHILIHILSVGSIFQLAYSVVEWCRNIAFIYALTNTVRYLRTGKLAKKGETS